MKYSLFILINTVSLCFMQIISLFFKCIVYKKKNISKDENELLCYANALRNDSEQRILGLDQILYEKKCKNIWIVMKNNSFSFVRPQLEPNIYKLNGLDKTNDNLSLAIDLFLFHYFVCSLWIFVFVIILLNTPYTHTNKKNLRMIDCPKRI